jgi:hypothetical protein
MELWHWFTGFGACLAVLNTLFLIFDRIFRYRPIISITAKPSMSGGVDANPYLRVKNIAPFDIVIERFLVEPPHCNVSANSEIRGIYDAITGTDVPILLGPKQERELVLIIRDRPKIRSDQTIKITIEWRRGQATWLRQCPVWIKTSLDDIDLRIRAAMNSRRT